MRDVRSLPATVRVTQDGPAYTKHSAIQLTRVLAEIDLVLRIRADSVLLEPMRTVIPSPGASPVQRVG
jgi:hypothetical protein